MASTPDEIDKVFVDLKTNLRKFIHKFGEEFVARVESRTPVVTGKLKAGWYIEYKKDGLVISNTQPYMSYVEYGTEHMGPRSMIRTTIIEKNEIADKAAREVGLKR
jgi:HK97 gp10 family phage protein